jgi:phosphopantothenate-cysteine ligase
VLELILTGTRGATSAEYFLSAGYAVIFLHRQHSLRPFSRHYSHSLNPFLDLLSVVDNPAQNGDTATKGQSIVVSSEHSQKLLPVLQAYHASIQQGTLLSVEFNTVNDYLWLLRDVTACMHGLGRRGMFYLAAAVSDFFLPDDKVVSVRSFISNADEF